jgi:hypothetical protein
MYFLSISIEFPAPVKLPASIIVSSIMFPIVMVIEYCLRIVQSPDAVLHLCNNHTLFRFEFLPSGPSDEISVHLKPWPSKDDV